MLLRTTPAAATALLLISVFAAPARAAQPVNEAAQFRAAIYDLKKGLFERGRLRLEFLAKKHPTRAIYWFNLGNVYFNLGRFADAANDYDRVIALHSPLAPVADLYAAKCYAKLSNSAEATRRLLELKAQSLPAGIAAEVDSDLHAIQGTPKINDLDNALALYRAGQYSDALPWVDEALRENPGAEVELLRGMIELRLWNVEDAKASLEAAQRSAAEDELRSDAARLLREIADGGWRRFAPYWIYAGTAAGYNSNLFGNGESEPRVAVAVARTRLGAGGSLLRRDPYYLLARYTFTWEEDLGQPSERFIGQALETALLYNDSKWTFEIAPTFQYQLLGDVPFLFVPGGRLRARRAFGSEEIGLRYEGGSNRGGADYGYLTGSSQLVRADWGWQGHAGYLGAFYLYSVLESGLEPLNNGGLLPLANHADGLGVTGAWFPASQRWRLDATLTGYLKSYGDFDVADGIYRDDKQLTAEAVLGYLLKTGVHTNLVVGYTVNSSNLGAGAISDENYQQFVSYLEIIWDALP